MAACQPIELLLNRKERKGLYSPFLLMAITLGTNGYISVADFKAWSAARGYELFDFIDSEIEAAITISSFDFIDQSFTFKGTADSSTQAMQLPTDEVAIADIANGAAQATWQQLNGLLFVTQTATGSAGDVIMQKDKLDVLETVTQYAEGSSRKFTHSTSLINQLLAKYITSSGVQLVRA